MVGPEGADMSGSTGAGGDRGDAAASSARSDQSGGRGDREPGRSGAVATVERPPDGTTTGDGTPDPAAEARRAQEQADLAAGNQRAQAQAAAQVEAVRRQLAELVARGGPPGEPTGGEPAADADATPDKPVVDEATARQALERLSEMDDDDINTFADREGLNDQARAFIRLMRDRSREGDYNPQEAYQVLHEVLNDPASKIKDLTDEERAAVERAGSGQATTQDVARLERKWGKFWLWVVLILAFGPLAAGVAGGFINLASLASFQGKN